MPFILPPVTPEVLVELRDKLVQLRLIKHDILEVDQLRRYINNTYDSVWNELHEGEPIEEILWTWRVKLKGRPAHVDQYENFMFFLDFDTRVSTFVGFVDESDKLRITDVLQTFVEQVPEGYRFEESPAIISPSEQQGAGHHVLTAELRTLCNRQGMSCRNSKGELLSRAQLLKRLK